MSAKRYRARPVDIDAVQWTGKNESDVREFVGDNVAVALIMRFDDAGDAVFVPDFVTIPTSAGDVDVDKGDYIIKDSRGGFYPCERYLFEEQYEEVTDNGR